MALVDLAFLVGSDQLAHILTDAAVSTFADPFLDEVLHRFGKSDVHGFHARSLLGFILKPLPRIVNRLPTSARPCTSRIWLWLQELPRQPGEGDELVAVVERPVPRACRWTCP